MSHLCFHSLSKRLGRGKGGGSRHACEESATYLEIWVEGNSLEEKLCQLLLQVGEESHRGDPTTGKQTSFSGTPVAQEVQFTFPFQWTRLLDKAFWPHMDQWPRAHNPGPSSDYKVTPMPTTDVMVFYNPLSGKLKHFPHSNPRGGRSKSATSPGSDQMAILGTQPSNHHRVVPSSKKLHPDSHGNYCRVQSNSMKAIKPCINNVSLPFFFN